MPLYRTLTAFNAKVNDAKIRFVVVSPEPSAVVEKFLADQQVNARVYQADLASLGIGSTPTVLLVSGNGLIQRAFIGKLSGARQLDLLTGLRKVRAAIQRSFSFAS